MGGSKISGKGAHMQKDVGIRFADFISFSETKLFHFHGIFKNGAGRGFAWRGVQANPLLTRPCGISCRRDGWSW